MAPAYLAEASAPTLAPSGNDSLVTCWRRALSKRHCPVSVLAASSEKMTTLRSQNPYTVAPKLDFFSNETAIIAQLLDAAFVPHADATKYT